MAKAVFRIGTLDIIDYIPTGGLEITFNELDSEESGRTLDGVLRRQRVAIAYNMSVPLIPELKNADSSKILSALSPKWVNVEFNDPVSGNVITRECYNSNHKSTMMRAKNGEIWWRIESFSLIDRGTPITPELPG